MLLIPVIKRLAIKAVIILLVYTCQPVLHNSSAQVIDSLWVGKVWSGHPVRFSLLTAPPHQFLAYYDSNRVMKISHRKMKERDWFNIQLDEVVGWDSHNYISMALDNKGHLHVSGNMHGDPLVYFKSDAPYDIQSLKRKMSLIGKDETNVTYPEFFKDQQGNLIFTYRTGGSGNGSQIYNKYNSTEQSWDRLLDQPIIDGKGKMNAYIHGPVTGPDGYFHMVWVWRDTPDAATNHDLSYAKSKDLVNWYQSDGTKQVIPITIDNCDIIDPVPTGQGMINGNTVIGFDREDNCIVSYHKFDSAGNTQIYQARLEDKDWKIYKSTNFNFKWDFKGRGSLNSRIKIYPVQPDKKQLYQKIWLDTAGYKQLTLKHYSLKALQLTKLEEFPHELDKPRQKGNQVNMVSNRIRNKLYLLRWETLPRNRDQPGVGPIPAPTDLVLYIIKK
ncbi:MAG: BNR repeat-containing protein [Candidatus Cyclobacteriaceae bacterium M3_2C_046]